MFQDKENDIITEDVINDYIEQQKPAPTEAPPPPPATSPPAATPPAATPPEAQPPDTAGAPDKSADELGTETLDTFGVESNNANVELDKISLIFLPKIFERFEKLKKLLSKVDQSIFSKEIQIFNKTFELFTFFVNNISHYQEDSETILREFNIALLKILKGIYVKHKKI